jgi:hypothetical protein
MFFSNKKYCLFYYQNFLGFLLAARMARNLVLISNNSDLTLTDFLVSGQYGSRRLSSYRE